VTADRNAFWTSSQSDAAVARFIELNPDNGMIIDLGGRNDYLRLPQWQVWTKQDLHSVYGNFTQDLTYLGTAPNQKLRVNMDPQPPLASILDNRGDRLSWVTTDIDGNTRGAAGQRYDIGAEEFIGRMYLADVEMLGIIDPWAYKAQTAMFADAEYIMTTAPVEIKAQLRNNGNLPQTGIDVTVEVYREMSNGQFSSIPEFPAVTVKADISSMETIDLPFNLADGQGTDFSPMTYAQLQGQGYVVPDQFASMAANVTPKYRIVARTVSDQQNGNNSVSKIVRFYIAKSPMQLVVTAENSMVNLDANSTADEIAGRLNFDAVKGGMAILGWFVDISDMNNPRYDYDIFDRNGWEPKAVNYTMYKTIWRSDASDKPMTRWERMDIRRFLDGGNDLMKKNLIVGSQEMVREQSWNTPNQDLGFVNDLLRAVNVAPENPRGAGVSNDGNYAIGVAVERGLSEMIMATGYTGDRDPYCGLMSVNSTGEGLAMPAYYYFDHNANPTDSVLGVATTTLSKNVVMLGVDWRHWGNIEMIIRGLIDYFEKNGSQIIPVELLAFNAEAVSNRVDLNWTTASEYNTDRFEVEKASVSEAGRSNFAKIGEEKAAGKSSVVRHYGPFVDNNVERGATYAYRLKMIDVTGDWSYSNVVEVTVGGTDASWLGNAVPNPANGESTIQYNLGQGSDIEISLYDIAGKKVMDLYNGYADKGSHELKADFSAVTSGVYTCVMRIGNENYSRQINVVK
jgi:hypothetical protein